MYIFNIKVQNQRDWTAQKILNIVRNQSKRRVQILQFFIFQRNIIQFYNYNTKYLNEINAQDKSLKIFKEAKNRCWGKKISYFSRKQVANNRLRVKGRFITRKEANKLSKMDTYNLFLEEIKDLLQAKIKKQQFKSMSLFGGYKRLIDYRYFF